ncbi:MAG: SDR family oxidoreductase [Rhodobacteraceae bacterium]|nr:SDR family oxidoreductase [Paracoccaceae bacterium]MCC6009166.1 SDR family oxidoreductase [Paracoccaceae bacterium]
MARRAILITGGARGIGRAIAEGLAPDHDIAITWNTAAEEAAVFSFRHPHALVHQADLATAPAAGIIAAVIDRFGRLDGFVNNAAAALPEPPMEPCAPGLARQVFAVNVTAPLARIGAALPYPQTGGLVVNFCGASALGRRGLRGNATAPGARGHPPVHRTDRDRLAGSRRRSHADAVAQAVRFLLSHAARAIAGTMLDGSAGVRR